MSEFNEQFKNTHVEPAFGNDGTIDDFYERLAESMESPRPNADSQELGIADSAVLAKVIEQLFDWLATSNINDPRCLKAMGMRVLAAAWVINPARYGNRSLHEIATKLGFGANNLSPLTAEFSRRFKVSNQFQAHDWRRKKP